MFKEKRAPACMEWFDHLYLILWDLRLNTFFSQRHGQPIWVHDPMFPQLLPLAKIRSGTEEVRCRFISKFDLVSPVSTCSILNLSLSSPVPASILVVFVSTRLL